GSKSPIDGVPVVFVSAGTIVVKEWLFRRTRLVAARCRSAALQGKAWDHRADVAVSSVVLAGGVGTIAGWSNADAVAGIVVGGVVFSVGVKLLFEILVELSEGSAGAAVEARIDAILKEIPEIRGWHRLRIRRIGRELLMDVHIMLDASLTIEAGHHIVRRIERTLSEGMDWPLHTVIHIDPDNEEIRNKRRALGDTTLRGTG
ncbi:MAG: cation diffusion facilitator family transporter, partial [Calditrichaeota bacterium]|nr:cation diffusion facilitator family transporter [Calditrichota bacterium]